MFMRRAASDRAELEVRAKAYRQDLEEEKAANVGLRFEVQTLREDVAIVGVLRAQVAAAEDENRRLFREAGSG
jgi:hypothetical protein